MTPENFSLKKELREAVAKGLNADSIKAVILPLLANRKADLWKTLCNSSPDYQKIDNSYYYALHLECKLITDMENEILSAVERGEVASDRLREMEQVLPARSIGSNLRM